MSAAVEPAVALADVAPLPPPETPWQRFRREFFASKLAVFGLVLLALVLLAALFAPWIAPQDPYDIGNLTSSIPSCRPAAPRPTAP